MTRPEIESQSTRSLVNSLLIRPTLALFHLKIDLVSHPVPDGGVKYGFTLLFHPKYFPISRGKAYRFMPFPRKLTQKEAQTALSKI